jgi:hypothetical protein
MIECKATGKVACLPVEMRDLSGLMTVRYYMKPEKENGISTGCVKVIARGAEAYWAMNCLNVGTRVRIKGRCHAAMNTLVIEQTSGRLDRDGK